MRSAVELQSTLTFREDGLPVITYLKPSRQAIDQWLAHVDTLLLEHPTNQTLNYILEHREIDNLPPITYAAQAVRGWLKRNPQHPNIRIASIHRDTMLLSVIDSLVQMLRANRVQIRFFTDEGEALRWLQATK